MLDYNGTNINKQVQTELNKAYFHIACVPCTAGHHLFYVKNLLMKYRLYTCWIYWM